MKSRLRFACGLFLTVALVTTPHPFAQETESAIAKQPARSSPQWLKSGVVYQIFVRAFSQSGDLNGVTARLDNLRALNVNILWLMPIHPAGQLNKKGSLGSRTRFATTTPSTRPSAQKMTSATLCRKPIVTR